MSSIVWKMVRRGTLGLLFAAGLWSLLAWKAGVWGVSPDSRVSEPLDDSWSKSKKFIEVQGTPVAYVERGQGPALLLLHGCPFHSSIWKDVLSQFAQNRRVLAPDLLGLGDTRVRLDDDYGLEREVEMVLGFLDALGIEKVDVVGADHGGATLQLMMDRHPERLGRVVLTNAEAYDSWPSQAERPYLDAVTHWFWSPLFRAALSLSVVRRDVFNIAVYDPKTLDDVTLASFVEVHTATPVRWQRLMRFYRSQLDPAQPKLTLAATDGLRRFTHPVLVLWGQEDENFGQQVARRLANDLPNSSLRWVPQAGHLPMLEAPATYVAEVNAFLAQETAL